MLFVLQHGIRMVFVCVLHVIRWRRWNGALHMLRKS